MKKGYIALTTVLIVLPILLLTGIDLVYKNIGLLLTSKMTYDSNILQINAETCLEESVYKIKRDHLFVGVFSMTQEGWSCNSIIAEKVGEPGVKLLSITATDDSDNYVNILKELNVNSDPFEISNI
ncbi:hypothetical protein GX656_01060 [Candidatus Dojkabacteria bacterium]|uniref:Uncharacterized protein n=1 Tax=Candidatus Dojkabacteria bacterium TaxID=2099670 RepID=A0A847D0B8_9BACT|nr:hypothetical protein [Candidatus Dojkabacteria bacterium]